MNWQQQQQQRTHGGGRWDRRGRGQHRGGGQRGGMQGRHGRGRSGGIEAYFSIDMLLNPWAQLEAQQARLSIPAAGTDDGAQGRASHEGLLDRPWH